IALLATQSFAQQPAATPDTNADTGPHLNLKRFYFGLRVEGFPLRLFNTNTAEAPSAQPITNYSYSAGSSSQKAAPAATFEYTISPRLSVGMTFYLTHAKFIQTTEVRTGPPSSPCLKTLSYGNVSA